ncbi:MAG TPA: NDP-sugar synthase [Thermoleophilia bacterium]|nr:NDP-sugar synthase [Thermoleophilia bacterium]
MRAAGAQGRGPRAAVPCTQAVILAGGEGTRLRPITSHLPKPVTPLVERPFVAYILDNLARHGVERAILSTGHLAEKVVDAIGDGRGTGVRVEHVREASPLGTAGAVANCAAVLRGGPLFALNGDVLSGVDLSAMVRAHEASGAMATICLTRVDDPSRYGVARLNADRSIKEFVEKPERWSGTALINAGVYLLDREVIDLIPAGAPRSLERDVFPRLAAAGRLFGWVDTGYWRDIGTPESYLGAHFDVLDGVAPAGLDGPRRAGIQVSPTAVVVAGARLLSPVHVGAGAMIEANAWVGPHAVVGAGARIHGGALVRRSVLQAGSVVGASAQVESTVLVSDARIGRGAQVREAVLGAGCVVGPGERPPVGVRLHPASAAGEGSYRGAELTGLASA